jgi:hypothetical protein
VAAASCDLYDDAFQCAHPGDLCVVWLPVEAEPGLEWLGACMTP